MSKLREIPTGEIVTEVDAADLTKNELLEVIESVSEYSDFHILRSTDGGLSAVTSQQSWHLDYECVDEEA